MFFSHRRSGQPGPITRIMCCTPEEYERLPEADRDLVPTHVAPSYTHHPRNHDTYSAYNKPAAIIDWLAKNDIKEDYVLVIDADMIMRQPFTAEVRGLGAVGGRAAFGGCCCCCCCPVVRPACSISHHLLNISGRCCCLRYLPA